MSEQSLVSRRGILTLAGGGLIGASAMAASAAGVRREELIEPNAQLINAQPADPEIVRAQIAEVAQQQQVPSDIGALMITRVPKFVITGQTMIPTAAVVVDRQFIGQQYNIRLGIQEDTGERRVEVQTNTATIPSEAFIVQITKDGNLPGDDWNLSANRLFVIQSTFNVVKGRAFAFAPIYTFKILDS